MAIIRKHRLTEMFLVEKMGFGWEEVHEIAEQVEHIQSPAFFEKMDDLLGHPETDPHGSPIPDRNGRVTRTQGIRLSECKPGETIILTAVEHSSGDFLKFLNGRNLKLGLKAKVVSSEKFDGSMVLQPGKGSPVSLSRDVCQHLLVQKM
jgi:DtxR family Mn-dependent transcriptional regulator